MSKHPEAVYMFALLKATRGSGALRFLRRPLRLDLAGAPIGSRWQLTCWFLKDCWSGASVEFINRLVTSGGGYDVLLSTSPNWRPTPVTMRSNFRRIQGGRRRFYWLRESMCVGALSGRKPGLG